MSSVELAMQSAAASAGAPDARAKQVLREAVDAVVNSFAKHTHGYGRGKGLFEKKNGTTNLSICTFEYLTECINQVSLKWEGVVGRKLRNIT